VRWYIFQIFLNSALLYSGSARREGEKKTGGKTMAASWDFTEIELDFTQNKTVV